MRDTNILTRIFHTTYDKAMKYSDQSRTNKKGLQENYGLIALLQRQQNRTRLSGKTRERTSGCGGYGCRSLQALRTGSFQSLAELELRGNFSSIFLRKDSTSTSQRIPSGLILTNSCKSYDIHLPSGDQEKM